MTQELEQDDAFQSSIKDGSQHENTESDQELAAIESKNQSEPTSEGALETNDAGQTAESTSTTLSESPQDTAQNVTDKRVEIEMEELPITVSNTDEIESPSHDSVEAGTNSASENEEHPVLEAVENYLVYSKEELVHLLDELMKENDFSAIRNKVFAIKEAFQTLISQERHVSLAEEGEEATEKVEQAKIADPVADKFFALMKKFNRRRIELREKQDLEKNDNLKAKSEILVQLKNLIQYEENMQKAFNQFHELQNKWRAIGPAPQQNVNDLWLTYKLYVDKFYELIRINKELQELDFKRNLSAKIKICERAEELILEPSINKALNHMQSLQNQFRETGPVPRDNKNEIWDRFKAASDKVYERKQEYLNEQKDKYEGSLTEKNALCQRAEELSKGTYLKSSEWQEKIKEFLQLQADWKKTGFSGKEENDKIWNRFKAAFDLFFQNKKAFYNKSKEESVSNLQKKTELCLHAEALKDSTEWKATTMQLKQLQIDWKSIGSAGEYNERKIFNRFRKACDQFFETKQKHFATQDVTQEENYQNKIKLIEAIESFTAADNHHDNIETLKSFQKQWMEMGMVPLPKKEEINTRYKKAIDQQFSNLRIDDSDRHKMKYVRKSEDYNKPRTVAGKDKNDDEKRFLLNKVSALKNDVSLWENNIGFFAKSKNAEVLKSEFVEKINTAKEEIKALNSKIEQIKKGSE